MRGRQWTRENRCCSRIHNRTNLLCSLHNDIFYLPLKGTIQLYSDDAAIIYSEKNFVQLKLSMVIIVVVLVNFPLNINLLIYAQKTKFIIFKPCNLRLTDIFSTLTFHNVIINLETEFEFLGLIIDETLNFSAHVNKITNRIYPYIGALKRLRL